VHVKNGKVGVVGGSAGGSHAAWVALNKSTSDGWPFWSPGDRANAVACLSGAYDYSDREGATTQVINDFENYTNTCIRVDQKTFSPVTLVTSTDIKPMFLINSEFDAGMPPHQIIQMQCALQTIGVDPALYKVWTIPGSDEHAFQYWDSPILDEFPPNNTELVRDRVIQFLDQYLKTP